MAAEPTQKRLLGLWSPPVDLGGMSRDEIYGWVDEVLMPQILAALPKKKGLEDDDEPLGGAEGDGGADGRE